MSAPCGKITRDEGARWVVTASGDPGWDEGDGKPPWRLMFSHVDDGDPAPVVTPSSAQLAQLIRESAQIRSLAAALRGAVAELLGEGTTRDEITDEVKRRLVAIYQTGGAS